RVRPRVPDGIARGDGALPPTGRGTGLRSRGDDRSSPHHAAGLRLYVARAARGPLRAGRPDRADPAGNARPRPAPPTPGFLRQGMGDVRPDLRGTVDLR